MRTQRTAVTSLLVAIVLALFAFFFQKCQPEPPAPGTTTKDPIIAPVAIAFFDVAPPMTVNVKDVRVTLIDSLGMVRTAGGDSLVSFDLEAGVMCLGLKKGTEVNAESPYSFSIKAEAADFSEVIQTIVLRGDQPAYVPVYMTKISNPAPGLVAGLLGINLVNSRVNEPLNVSLPVAGSGAVRFTIPAETRLLTGGKDSEAKEARLRITYGDPIQPNANRVFPNGPLVTNAIDSAGRPVATPDNPFYFESLGWISINIDSDAGEIDGFSQPVEVELPINPELMDPKNKEPYRVGQKVPVWSLDERTGVWREEFSTPLRKGENGVLVATFKIQHLSTWNLDYKMGACSNVLQIVATNNGCPGMFYSEIQLNGTALSPTLAGTTNSHTLFYNNGPNTFTVANAPDVASGLRFLVYNNATGPTGPMTTAPAAVLLNNCPTGTVNFSFTPPTTTGCERLGIEMELHDASASPVKVNLCNNALWYKEISNSYNPDDPNTGDLAWNTWKLAGFFAGSGVCETAQLNSGSSYRFLVWFGKDKADQSIRFTVGPSDLTFTSGCGLSPNSLNLRTGIAGALSGTLFRHCYATTSSSGCTDPAGNGSYICSPGGIFTTVRGLFIRIEGLPAGFVVPCS